MGIFLYNALFTFLAHILKERRKITRRMIVMITLLQIAADLVAISALVHNTGGVENYYIILVLVPIVIATELLPQGLAYATAAGAAVLVNVLAWCEQQGILPHVRVELLGEPGAVYGVSLYADRLYVLHVTTAVTVAIFGLVFVASTIASRLREREAELEDAHHRLRRTDEAKSFFMRKASHEMRAPLSAIHSMLDAIVVLKEDLSEEQSRMLNRVKHRTRGLIALVKDLHRYSMLRTTDGVFQRQEVSLGEIVRNTSELFREKARAAGLEIRCRARPIRVQGDEELLREVVTNLVSNAVQYTPEGGSIDVTMTVQDGEAVLAVADTGIGISEKAREHIFDDFYRSGEARQFFRDGTGLGLAITRRIVHMHDGVIDATPRPERGTVFRVCLPLNRSKTEEPGGESAPSS